jgi:transposase
MQAYSIDLRERVLADSDAGMKSKALAEKYRVSESWVRKVRKRWRETGQMGPRQQRISHATKLDNHQEHLQKLVEEKPDATLQELCDQLPVKVSPATMSRALARLKLTFKKKYCMPKSSTGRMCMSSVCDGVPRCCIWTCKSWCLSMKPASARIWSADTAAPRGESG